MYEVRVFVIVRTLPGGGDEIVALRLSRQAAETIVRENPELRLKRGFANKKDGLSDIEKLKLAGRRKAA